MYDCWSTKSLLVCLPKGRFGCLIIQRPTEFLFEFVRIEYCEQIFHHMRKCLCVRLQEHPNFEILFQSIRKWIEICQHPHIIVDVVAQRAVRLLFGTVRFIFSIHSKRGGVSQCCFIHNKNAIAFFQFNSVSCLLHILCQTPLCFQIFLAAALWLDRLKYMNKIWAQIAPNWHLNCHSLIIVCSMFESNKQALTEMHQNAL